MTLISTPKSVPEISIAGTASAYRSEIISRQLDTGSIPFEIETAYRFLKLRKSSSAREEFDAAIDAALPICRKEITPTLQYVIVGVVSADLSTGSIDLADGIRFESQGLMRSLADARAAAFFVLTLGDAIDELVEEWTVSDFPMAYVADGVASTLLHGLLKRLEDELQSLAERSGLALGKRFSPGFHRWDLNQQRQLFDLLDPETIGVELTSEYVMLPRHSLSGVYPINPSRTDRVATAYPSILNS